MTIKRTKLFLIPQLKYMPFVYIASTVALHTPMHCIAATPTNLVKKTTKNIKEQPKVIDAELSKNPNLAMRMINESLLSHPHDKTLLTQKAESYHKLHLYSQSAQSAQQALALDPNYGPAKEALESVKEISPNRLWGRNEIGISTLNEYVSDLHQNWDYTQLHLSRDTAIGTVAARLNYANRHNIGGYQGEFEFYPVINPYVNLDLYYSFSDQPNLFPKDAFAAEGYVTAPKFATFSLGEYYAHILGIIGFKKTTGSISKDIGNNTFTFRTNYYTPNRGQNSTLYIATVRHYFKNLDCYLNLTGGWGSSPDLADLLTTNFIVIKNRFINVNFRFPLFHNRVLVDLGADYQNWKYPTGLDRQLTGGSLGVSYRF